MSRWEPSPPWHGLSTAELVELVANKRADLITSGELGEADDVIVSTHLHERWRFEKLMRLSEIPHARFESHPRMPMGRIDVLSPAQWERQRQSVWP